MAKKALTILIDKDIYLALEKRAKRNLLSLREQISDILRRSVLSAKKRRGYSAVKTDDKFIEYFSRHKSGRKRKKKKK